MKPSGEFHKSLNLFDSTAIVIGSMIGSGIFIVSADIARNVGAPGWLLIVWAISGIMTVFAALSYGELAGMMPQAGGIYVYLREAYSPLFGFLYGWTLFLVVQTGTIAAVAMAFGKYSGVLIPWISEKNYLFQIGWFKLNTTQLVAISSIVLLTVINSRGIEQGKRIQNTFTYSKIFILALFIIVGYVFSKNTPVEFWSATQWDGSRSIPVAGFALIAAIGVAMVGSLFSADAWYDITFASGEVINPKQNIPKSLFLGTLIVSVLYVLINIVYIYILPLNGISGGSTVFERGIRFASEDRVATAAMYQVLGNSAAIVMAVIVVISTFGCNNGIILSGARVYYAMAKDNLFFKNASILNSKGVPAVGLTIQAVWCTILCLSGTYGQLLDYVVFAALIFFILTITAVFVLRKKWPEVERPYKAFGFPVLPAIYILLCIVIEVILFIYKPKFTWPGMIIVISGVPVYYIWKYFSRKNNIV
jgi:APA family basic amino acid/polyamine antiporter